MSIRGIHYVDEIKKYPVEEVDVDKYFRKGYLEGADRVSIESYKIRLLLDDYEPIQICALADDPVIDGTHRLIAAYELGMKKIKAHVCQEHPEAK